MKEPLICSFFGHRDVDVTETLYDAVYKEVVRLLKKGVRIFYFGGLSDFDALCNQIVQKIAAQNAQFCLKRVFVVAQERHLRKPPRWLKKEDYDEVIFLPLSFGGWYKSLYFRNCAMIDNSSSVVFFAQECEGSGAYKALEYAKKKKGLEIVNLWGVDK